MAVKIYIQTAMTQLQTAIAEMESQIHGMQRDAENHKGEISKAISELERERVARMAELGHEQDDMQKRMTEQRITEINHTVDNHRSELSRIESDLSNAQQRKDVLHRDLYNTMGELNRLVALPDID